MNAPVAPALFSVTLSPGVTPAKAALAVLIVAVVVVSYNLLVAVIPVTFKNFGTAVPEA